MLQTEDSTGKRSMTEANAFYSRIARESDCHCTPEDHPLRARAPGPGGLRPGDRQQARFACRSAHTATRKNHPAPHRTPKHPV